MISNGRSHFLARQLESLLKKYKVNHRVTTPYHPQIRGKVEVFNREIKAILEKAVSLSSKVKAFKLDDAFWTY